MARVRNGTDTRSTGAEPASTPADEQLSRLARGVAHPLRVRILRLLMRRGQCVCGDIVEEVPRAQSTVSQHLKVLKESGLIRGNVEPPRVCYCVDEDGVRRLKKLIGEL
jgi:ArsR family transcriptional regulator